MIDIPATAYYFLWNALNALFDLDAETITVDELQGYCMAALPEMAEDERTRRGHQLRRELERAYRAGGYGLVDGTYLTEGVLHAVSIHLPPGERGDA